MFLLLEVRFKFKLQQNYASLRSASCADKAHVEIPFLVLSASLSSITARGRLSYQKHSLRFRLLRILESGSRREAETGLLMILREHRNNLRVWSFRNLIRDRVRDSSCLLRLQHAEPPTYHHKFVLRPFPA